MYICVPTVYQTWTKRKLSMSFVGHCVDEVMASQFFFRHLHNKHLCFFDQENQHIFSCFNYANNIEDIVELAETNTQTPLNN